MSVNKLFFSIVALLAFASCASEYRIVGTSSVSRLDGKLLYVKVPHGERMLDVDSAEVVHGVFKMEGVADTAALASLYMDNESIMPFVIEEGEISIDINRAYIKVSGTPLNDRLYDFVAKKTALDDRAYELERKESRMIMDGMAPDEIQRIITEERELLSEEMDTLAKTFIQENYNNVLGPGIFIILCNSFPYPVMTPVIEEILDAAPDSFKNDPMVKDYVTAARANME